ncbi:serine hydrolase domain-containing protein [Sorangium cellulosum]|uniref:serine hydrolase domain-containing protein n=1 Tax=Sorangium cellulosum TaxID=56 RepID=UPI0009D70D7F|nr:serine hydrolase domain-containing protein [Sorangium cellulosum]
MPLVDLTAVAALVVEEHSAAPCACVAAAVHTRNNVQYGFGAAGHLWFESSPPANARGAAPPAATGDAIFDLASVTKPLTALALARLARAGAVRLDEPLGQVLPELAGTRSARVPLELLAAHRAGLEAHRVLHPPGDDAPIDPRRALLECANGRREACAGDPPDEGFPPVYSDLGYLLLGAALARRGAAELDEIVAREVTGPLGLAIAPARALRRRDPRFDERVVPTEDVAFRGGVIRGAVHDDNAWTIARDAMAGHAGLFGDAMSVARLGVALLEALAGERPAWLTRDELCRLVAPRPGGSLRAGFDGRSGERPSSGARFGPRTFGHLGFTGTSLWIDPDAGLVGVLLTNRVHPTRASDAIRRARPAAHDAIAEAMARAR